MEVERQLAEEAAAEEKPLPIGRIEYLHTDGRVREQIEYTDIAEMEADLRADNDSGVPMKVTMYVDRQGKTVPHHFVYEMDPPLHGTSVIMNPYIQVGLETPLEKAMRLISDFCKREYGQESDFDNLREIGIGHTTITDAEIPIQINVNLEDFALDRYIEGILVDQRKYDSLTTLIEAELENLDFEDLIYFTDEQLAKAHIYQRDSIQMGSFFQDNERIEVKQYPNGYYYNHYGYDPERDTAASVAGPFESYEEAVQMLLSHRPQAQRLEPEHTEPFVDHFYVVADIQKRGTLDIQKYSSLNDALNAYWSLPTSQMKALGAMNTRKPLPGSLDLLHCKDGVDTIVEDYLKVEGWNNDEILGAVQQLKDAITPRVLPSAPSAPKPKHNFLIHDYFFARTLDKVRPGGIVAFITSKGTMDKENPAVRKYIAQRADLLGAIRLPNDTFKSAAGTEVTSDIIFLQKRDRMVDIEPAWVHLNTDANGHKMNQYFIDNPDMILGDMKQITGPFGPELACVPFENLSLEELLSDAIQNIHAEITEYDLDEVLDGEEDLSIPALPNVRNFSYAVVEGKVYYRENSRMNPVDVSATAESRI